MKPRQDFSQDGDLILNGFVQKFRSACEMVVDDNSAIVLMRLLVRKDDTQTPVQVTIIAENTHALDVVNAMLRTLAPDETLIGNYCTVRKP